MDARYQSLFHSLCTQTSEMWSLRVTDTKRLERLPRWWLHNIKTIQASVTISQTTLCVSAVRMLEEFCSLLVRRCLLWFAGVSRPLKMEITKWSLLKSSCAGWKCHLGDRLNIWPSNIKMDEHRLGLPLVFGIGEDEISGFFAEQAFSQITFHGQMKSEIARRTGYLSTVMVKA